MLAAASTVRRYSCALRAAHAPPPRACRRVRSAWRATASPRAVTGGVVGAAVGWFGFAAGLIAGGAVGGRRQAEHLPELRGELFEEIRADVPEHASAIILLAAPGHVDAMTAAFEGSGGRLIRRSLSDAMLTSLEAVVAEAPFAAGHP